MPIIHGTFTYDSSDKRLCLQSAQPLTVLDIRLPGDAVSSVYDNDGMEVRQYSRVTLWLEQTADGTMPRLATATPAPPARRCRPGNALLRLLCLPTCLAQAAAFTQKQHQQPGGDGEYQRPPRAAFVPELCAVWRCARRRIIAGWLLIATILGALLLGAQLL